MTSWAETLTIFLNVGNINETDETVCDEPLIDDTLFYQLALIPAALIVLSFCFTQKRRRLLSNILHGRPGLIHPMDILTRSDRISYACAFGTTVYLVIRCIFHNFRAIDYHGPLVMDTVILLVSVLIFGVVHLPVFAALSSGSVLGFGIGTLYTWMLTILQIIRMCDCDFTAVIRLTVIAEHLPHLLCLLFLSGRMPYRFLLGCRFNRGCYSSVSEKRHELRTFEDLMESDIGIHVSELLKKPNQKENVCNGIKEKVIKFILDHTYRRKPGFRYSARFLSTFLVALILLYVVSFEAFTLIVAINTHLKRVFIDDLRLAMLSESHIDDVKELIKYCIRTLTVTVTFSTALGLYGILRMCTEYRTMMYKLYKGQMKHLWRDRSSADLLLSAMKYSGYQVVSVVWGFIIHSLIFLIFCSIISILIYLIRHDMADWFTNGLGALWPIPFWAILINVVQMALTRTAFLENGGKHLVLNNRRVLFVVSYFMFFYNIFLGMFSFLLRMVKSVVIGSIILPRLDYSVLPENFVSMDPGYLTYVGFIKLESDHSHPVMLTFIRLLYIGAKARRMEKIGGPKDDDGQDQTDWWGPQRPSLLNDEQSKRIAKRRDAAFKWQVLYTLINNPDLRVERKGYIQKTRRARQLGITLAKSDVYIVIDDEMLREAEEEHNRKNVNLVGKITHAAGQNLHMIKNKVQNLHTTYFKGKGSSESLDHSDDDEQRNVTRHQNGGAKTRSEGNEHRDDGNNRPKDDSRSKSGNSKEMRDVTDGGSGDIRLAYVGNKRRRREERERGGVEKRNSDGGHGSKVDKSQMQGNVHNTKNSQGFDDGAKDVDPVRPQRNRKRESREADDDKTDSDRREDRSQVGPSSTGRRNARTSGTAHDTGDTNWVPRNERVIRHRSPRTEEISREHPRHSRDMSRADRGRSSQVAGVEDDQRQKKNGRESRGHRNDSFDDDDDVMDDVAHHDKDDYDDDHDIQMDKVMGVWTKSGKEAIV